MNRWARLALMVTALGFPAVGGAENFSDSPVFALDAREAALAPLIGGVPYTAVSAFDDGIVEALRDLNGNGYPDAFEDVNRDGVPDAFEAVNGEGLYAGFLDANQNGYADWFEARYSAVTVNIEPESARTAGARWSVNGGDWMESGAEVSLAPGPCTVTFNSVSDWLTPPAAVVMIEALGTANVTGTYLDFGIASVDRLLGLSLGGDILTLNVVGLTEDTVVYLGDQQAFTTDQSNIEAGLLVVETPSQWPGEYELRIEDTASGAEYVFGDLFVYTDNPFESGADQFPGEMRLVQDTPEDVSTSCGSLPVEGNALQPLEYETPEGVVVQIPVDALPANTTRAFVVIRSSASLENLFEEPVVIPADTALRSPYVDIHILVELDANGEDAELEMTVSAPVVLRFPHYVAPEAWDTLEVGRMDTDLDEQFRSLLPDPLEILPFDNLVVDLDDQDRVVVEVEHFTVYGLLGPTAPAPVSVPDVVGMTQANAEATLTGAGLIVGAVTEQHSESVPVGQVISSLPCQGVEVMPGSAVDLVISKGPAACGAGCHGGLSSADNTGDKLLLLLAFGTLLLMAGRRKRPAS